MTKSTMLISLIYVNLKFEDVTKKVTLATNNVETTYDAISEYTKHDVFGIKAELLYENTFKVSKAKDPILFNACEEYFKEKTMHQYSGMIQFDAELEEKSFKKEVLFATNKYTPSNPLEDFLFSNNILKAYYNKNIEFKIEANRTEFSSEFGERVFPNIYETKELNWEKLNVEDTQVKDVYVAKVTPVLLSIKGKNDEGKEILININKTGSQQRLVF